MSVPAWVSDDIRDIIINHYVGRRRSPSTGMKKRFFEWTDAGGRKVSGDTAAFAEFLGEALDIPNMTKNSAPIIHKVLCDAGYRVRSKPVYTGERRGQEWAGLTPEQRVIGVSKEPESPAPGAPPPALQMTEAAAHACDQIALVFMELAQRLREINTETLKEATHE